MLRGVARIVKQELRACDIVCRRGGEEFLVVLKRTPLPQGQALAGLIRASAGAETFRYGETAVAVTVSVGLAAFVEGGEPDALIERADKALYEAKALGRDRVRSAASA